MAAVARGGTLTLGAVNDVGEAVWDRENLRTDLAPNYFRPADDAPRVVVDGPRVFLIATVGEAPDSVQPWLARLTDTGVDDASALLADPLGRVWANGLVAMPDGGAAVAWREDAALRIHLVRVDAGLEPLWVLELARTDSMDTIPYVSGLLRTAAGEFVATSHELPPFRGGGVCSSHSRVHRVSQDGVVVSEGDLVLPCEGMACGEDVVFATDLATAGDGEILVAGLRERCDLQVVPGQLRAFVGRLTSDANWSWTAEHLGSANIYAFSRAVHPVSDGGVIVVGAEHAVFEQSNAWVARFRP